MHVVVWRRRAGWDVARSAYGSRRAAARALGRERTRYPGADFRIEEASVWVTSVFILVVLRALIWSCVAVVLVIAVAGVADALPVLPVRS